MQNCAAVAAITKEGGLGYQGRLPWHPRRLTLDLAFLQFITTNDYKIDTENSSVEFVRSCDEGENVVVMGRKTWGSLPPKFRPLKLRRNVVISRDTSFNPVGAVPMRSLSEASEHSQELSRPLFLLGGASIYQEGIESGLVDCLFVTELVEHPEMQFDVSFPVQLVSRFSRAVNVTKQAFDELSKTVKTDQEHYLQGETGHEVFVDGDVKYRIVCYF